MESSFSSPLVHRLDSFRSHRARNSSEKRRLFNSTVKLHTARDGQQIFKLKSCRDLIYGKAIQDYETMELVFN